jgi:hypothetical protein
MGAVALVVGAAGAVGMDALGDGSEQGFEVQDEALGFGLMGFGFGIRFGGDGFGLGWVVEFGDAVFPLVELEVEDADLADVAAFEAVELGAEVIEFGFADGQRGAKNGEFGAAAVELGFFRPGLAEDRGGLEALGWHGLV